LFRLRAIITLKWHLKNIEGKKKTPTARIRKITGRHGEEMTLTAYIRRLDKIYTDLEMPDTFLKVVKLLRSEYRKNPHELYMKVCTKWGIEPEEEVDTETLVYGKSRSQSRSRRYLLMEQERERESQKKAEKTDKKEEKEEKETPVEDNAQASEAAADNELEAQAEKAVKKDDEEQVTSDAKDEYINVVPGDIVETVVLTESTSDQETGFWVPARILSINEGAMNMNLQVLQPLKYNLAETALAVPYRYVRAPVTVTFEY